MTAATVPAVPACCTLKGEDGDSEEEGGGDGGGARGRQEAAISKTPDPEGEGGRTMLIESSVT